MKSKQERKDEAWEEYKKIRNPAWEEYHKKCKGIDAEEEIKCPTCGK